MDFFTACVKHPFIFKFFVIRLRALLVADAFIRCCGIIKRA